MAKSVFDDIVDVVSCQNSFNIVIYPSHDMMLRCGVVCKSWSFLLHIDTFLNSSIFLSVVIRLVALAFIRALWRATWE